jgi:hypothetical protein
VIRKAARKHPRRLVALVAIVPAIILLLGWHYWVLYSSLTGARDDLLSAQARLSDVGLDLTAADLAVARERLAAADGKVGQARTHFRLDPIIQGARLLPVASDQVNAVRSFIHMAGLLSEIGLEASDAGERAIALREDTPPGQPLTASVVQLLLDTGPSLERIQGSTDELVSERLRLGDRDLLPPLDSARRRLDRYLPQLSNTVEQLARARDLLPGLLGFNGGRRYLVLPLNNGELLPGGGLVTAAGVLPVENGVNGPVTFTDSTLWKDAWESRGGAYIPPPGPLGRYLLRDFTWNLLVSNWSPDFPTWAQQALQFYELVHGPQDVSGVIAVDLDVLQRLLAVTGPVTVPVEGGEATFTSENAIIELERLTRPAFEITQDRKSVIGDVSQAVLATLLHLPSERWATALDTIRELGRQRHLQVLSFDPAEQTLVRDVEWDGRLLERSGDYLQLNEASLNSTKLNLIIKPEAAYTVDVGPLGDARHELRLRYRNSLPEWSAGKDPGFVQQLMLEGLYGGYLRVFVPRGSSNVTAEIDGTPAALEDIGADSGKDWFGVFFSLPAGQEAEVVFRWSVPLATDSRGARDYDLYVQKQPGTTGMCMAVTVSRGGAPARRLSITGGSRDAGGRTCLTTDVEIHAAF